METAEVPPRPRSNGRARRPVVEPERTTGDKTRGLQTRREEIIAVASVTFARRGYTNTSMRDIADASGLLAGSLYSHFRSKSEILRLILEPLLELLIPTQEATLQAGGPGLEQVGRMIHDVMAILADHGEEVTILHYDWSDLHPLEDLASVVAGSNRILELWRAAVVDGIEDGSIRSDVDPDSVVRAITASMHAVVDRKRFQALPGTVSSPLDAEGAARQLEAIFSSGLAATERAGTRSERTRS
jgi:TetR/AcrR family transcriptional regulator, cholesterol catabolism regulator